MNVWKHNSEEEGIEMLEKEGRDQRKGKKKYVCGYEPEKEEKLVGEIGEN